MASSLIKTPALHLCILLCLHKAYTRAHRRDCYCLPRLLLPSTDSLPSCSGTPATACHVRYCHHTSNLHRTQLTKVLPAMEKATAPGPSGVPRVSLGRMDFAIKAEVAINEQIK